MSQSPISFAGFRFDAGTGELSGPSGRIRLGPQPARVLAMLVQRPGELVTRDELKRALWPDTVVEADQGLNFCVLQLRSALGDEAAKARFIETLPRRGYRFVAPIDEASPASEPPTTTPPAPVRRPPSFPRFAAIGAAIVIAAGALWAFGSGGRRVNRNVAIMPLAAQPGDPAWVAEVSSQVSDRLVTLLTAQAPRAIGVVGPLTTQRFVGDSRPLSDLGRALDVGYVMSGAIRVSDSTVFIQVVRVTDGVHVCAFRRPAIGVNLDTVVAAIVAGTARKILALGADQSTDYICGRPRT